MERILLERRRNRCRRNTSIRKDFLNDADGTDDRIVATAELTIANAAIAEDHFLILTKKGTGLERIEMDNLEDCKELGEQWSAIARTHTYACLKPN